MPSRTEDYTKAQRMLLVRRAIENIGEADVRHIREFLSSNYGFENTDTLRRRIYEDLNGLHEMKEIEFHYLNDENSEIEDSRRTYTLFGSRHSIVGVNLLKDFGGEFFSPSTIKVPWQVTNRISLEPPQKHIKIIFHAGHDFYLLSLPKGDLPTTVVIGRTFYHQKFSFPSAEFIKTYGIRASYLGLPYGELSVRSDESSVGHAVLKFDLDGGLTVSDLNTANYTEVATDIQNTLVPEIYGLVFNSDLPLSYRLGYRTALEDSHNFKRIRNKPESFPSPTLLRLGKRHLFIVGDFVKPADKEVSERVNHWKKFGTEESPDIAIMMSNYFKDKRK